MNRRKLPPVELMHAQLVDHFCGVSKHGVERLRSKTGPKKNKSEKARKKNKRAAKSRRKNSRS